MRELKSHIYLLSYRDSPIVLKIGSSTYESAALGVLSMATAAPSGHSRRARYSRCSWIFLFCSAILVWLVWRFTCVAQALISGYVKVPGSL